MVTCYSKEEYYVFFLRHSLEVLMLETIKYFVMDYDTFVSIIMYFI